MDASLKTKVAVLGALAVLPASVTGHATASKQSEVAATPKPAQTAVAAKLQPAEPCPTMTAIPAPYADVVCKASLKYQADPSLVGAILWYENRSWPAPDKFVCSHAGACGIAQFIPRTWSAYGVDADGDGVARRESWVDSIYSAAHYLARQPGDVTEKAIRYNCGPGCVGRALPAETRDYIAGVNRTYRLLRK